MNLHPPAPARAVETPAEPAARAPSTHPHATPITCFIRYQIDPGQREAFRRYALNWAGIIPRCGGHLIGYYLPHEGTNDEAWGLIGFASLADYERYRARLKADPEGRANFEWAGRQRFIVRETRTWLEAVAETRERAALPAA